MSQFAGIGMTSKRTRMRLIDRLKSEGIHNSQVLDAILNTPRHIFVDEAISHRAYEDVALPIGFGQTISQPFIVAQMTQLLLEAGPLNNVLEIGTGSGYQAAILAKCAKQVVSLERIEALYLQAKKRLQQLAIGNVELHYLDGSKGFADKAPYDAIIVTAAPEEIPMPLLTQLKPEGGCLVSPVGVDEHQRLQRVIRHGEEYEREKIEAVRFVPFLSGKS